MNDDLPSPIIESLGRDSNNNYHVSLLDGSTGVIDAQTGNWHPDGTVVSSNDKKLKHSLIKEMDMDANDLILHLFKGQPRLVGCGLFTAERHNSGTRHFERDNSAFREEYTIYHKGTAIAIIIGKPHKKVMLLAQQKDRKRAKFAQSLFYRVLQELFPAVKLVTGDKL